VELGPNDAGVTSIVRLVQPFVYEADATNVDTLYTNIAAITVSGYETEATPETLPLYGLDAPRYVLEVKGTGTDADGNSIDGVPLLTLRVGLDKDATSTYIKVDDTDAVYTAKRDLLTFLSTATAPNLVDRFANIINIAKVDRVEIVGMGVDDTMAISRTPDLDDDGNQKVNSAGVAQTIDEYTFNGESIDESTFKKLYQLVIGTRVDGVIPDGQAPDASAEPVLTVVYRLNTGSGAAETIEYVPYNTDYYAVRRNGLTLFYLLKTRVEQIPKALDAYRDGTFNPKDFGLS